MKKSVLSLAVLSAINMGAAAQDFSISEDDVVALEEVLVTGSLIPRTNFDGPSPVAVIDSSDIKGRGFSDLTDVLRSVSQATGGVQGEQFSNSFTPNAQEVNLRGFGAGRTLVLLNGRRLPDNPTPFNGQSNFFNFATIPLAAVDRIEVMTDGASAVYGSDAIAGVVNIITKKNFDNTIVTLQKGTTTEGGGDSTKLQAVSGFAFDRGEVTLTAEYQEQQPIYGKDRSWMDSYMDQPEELRFPQRGLLMVDPRTGQYLDPGAEACEQSGIGYEYATRPGSGNYCGFDGDGEESLRNYRERRSVFANARYELTDDIEAFASAMYWDSNAEVRGLRLWWGDYTLDQNLTHTYHQKVFSPAEAGEQDALYEESTWNITAGVSGDVALFGSYFNWEAAYTLGRYDYENTKTQFKEEAIREHFLGDTDLWGFGILAGNPDHSIYDFMPADVLAELTGVRRETAESESQQFTVSMVGDLFDMPTSKIPAAIAVQFEYADQSYDLSQDDRTLNQQGMGWFAITGTEGGGDRARTALGVELSLPVLDNWEVSLASRYDRYDDDSDVGGRISSQVKTRYDIADQVSVRGGWSQSFRAPDMHYLYAAESGFYTTTQDFYKCSVDGGVAYDDWGTCDEVQVAGARQGSLELAEETGENINVGLVFNPVEDLQLAVDWYRIDLSNIVLDEDIRQLMRDEAECRLGMSANEDYCDLLYSKVERVTNPALNMNQDLSQVNVIPINQSKLTQEGIDASVQYEFSTENFGSFELAMTYSFITKYEETILEGDKPNDLLQDLSHFEPRTKLNGGVTWVFGDFRSTLFGQRLGSMPNWAETERLDNAWTTWNLSLGYDVTQNLGVSLSATNVLNERPPEDETFDTWPYFHRGQYNAVGREVFADVVYRF
ncbi:TonB-dependent receptor domain-containing protein [Microbulbifer agarilyticus]